MSPFLRRLAFAALFSLPVSAFALQEPAHVRVDLLSEARVIAPATPFWVALRMKADSHWHTYWKNPGDSGAPTKIKWKLPAGFTAGPIEWPYPQRIELPPLVSFAYEGETLLLVKITPPANLAPNAPVALGADVSWLECDELCLPGEAPVATVVRSGAREETDPAVAKIFSDARSRLPLANAEWTFTAAAGDGFVRLTATPPLWLKSPVGRADFFPDEPSLYRYDATEWVRRGGAYEMDLFRSDISSAPLTRVSGVLVSKDGWRGAGSERAVAVNAAVSGVAETRAAKSSAGLLAALAFAFIGGLILNLMPCVLPVLSIKVLSLVGQAESPPSARLRNAAAYAAGVLVAFWALAGALIALRAGGEQLGWGFQLQSPPVIAALASLFFLIMLNMFGVFEIGVSLTRLGAPREGPGSSFSTGLLATVVATPCTAPFMGSALGYALTQPALVAFAVFTALGAGMAAPFVLLAASPRLLKFLPRPGAWMETMKQLLGFFLAATVVWLAWVLGRQAGVESIVVLLGALVIQSIGAWVFGKWSPISRARPVRLAAVACALLLVGGGAAAAILLTRSAPPAMEKSAGKIAWEPFSDARVEELRAAGTPVFVDFGAAWCLTCQVNERVALSAASVAAKFKEKGVATLKADWTSRDPAITEALARLGRSGVPTYALYASDPKAAPKVLPEILTPTLVIEALDKIE